MKLSAIVLSALLLAPACGPTDSTDPGASPGPDAATPGDPPDSPDGPSGCGDDVCAADAGVPSSDPSADAGPGPDPDPPVTVDVDLFLVGDCVTAECPPEAPFPVSCEVFFSPGDDRGCVASTPLDSVVYFQAGDQCNEGLVAGTLTCSDTPGAPLTQTSCPINKPVPLHPDDPSGCPEITD